MDEVGEMSLRMQAMLLRFLETGEIQRVGSDRRLPPVDVRVITATNRRLVDAMADKTFREDLYYRLNVVHIEIPPLRDRREDVLPLLRHFLGAFSEAHRRTLPEVSPDALEQLMAYRWPGNVRELKNVAERLVLKGRTGRIEADMLPSEVLRGYRETPALAATPPSVAAVHDELFVRLTGGMESFWSAVYEPFMARDLTRRTMREIVSLGLQQTRGNYRMLVTMFNMPEKDYKRFLHFLRKYQCHVPFQEFRMMRTNAPSSIGFSVRRKSASTSLIAMSAGVTIPGGRWRAIRYFCGSSGCRTLICPKASTTFRRKRILLAMTRSASRSLGKSWGKRVSAAAFISMSFV